ncbi:TPA: hypothetical protein P0E28_001453 [Vibrio campbellii]|nr:hypothetical protein [Vibrio campbellii]
MKNFINSILETTSVRLRSPLVGAFFFSWIVLNINGIALFIMVDTPQRIDMVRGKSWFWVDDVAYPLGLSLCYLFLLPLFHYLYDVFDSFVSKRRLNLSRSKTLSQIQAEPRNIKTKYEHDLEALIEEKVNLEEQVLELGNILEGIKERGFSIADEEWVHPFERVMGKMKNTVVQINRVRI